MGRKKRKYLNDDGSYTQNCWQWIFGLCYYFDADGYVVTGTTTPDGYLVDSFGAWTIDGVNQIKKKESGDPDYCKNIKEKYRCTEARIYAYNPIDCGDYYEMEAKVYAVIPDRYMRSHDGIETIRLSKAATVTRMHSTENGERKKEVLALQDYSNIGEYKGRNHPLLDAVMYDFEQDGEGYITAFSLSEID